MSHYMYANIPESGRGEGVGWDLNSKASLVLSISDKGY